MFINHARNDKQNNVEKIESCTNHNMNIINGDQKNGWMSYMYPPKSK